MDIQTKDGIVLRNIPDGTPDEEIKARIAQIRGGAAPSPAAPQRAPVEPPNAVERFLAKWVPDALVNNRVMTNLRGEAMGMADPGVGLVQLAANVLPDSTGIPQKVNQAIQAKDQAYQQERGAMAGQFDPARLLGNVASPANLAVAARVPAAATTAGRIGVGAGVGAAGGATAPIENGGQNYWGQKAVQTGVGAAAGGVLTPIAGAIADKVGRFVASRKVDPAQVNQQTDRIIMDTLAEMGQKLDDIPKVQLDSLRAQVVDALKSGKALDAAALLRKGDFEAEGIQHTLGQVTRDPTQFARERNLRGVNGVGEPLMNLMDAGNQQLQKRVGQYGANATESFPAGEQLAEALRKVDTGMKRNVTDLYSQARNSAGKDLDVPMQGLAQDYATVLHEFGDKVPTGVRNVLNDYGLLTGNQNKVFTVEAADKVLKVINANQSNDPATNAALGQLRAAVKASVTAMDASGGAFAPAVKAAAERFKLQEAIPALEAASQGAPGDKFVEKFVLQGKVREVQRLADLLKKDSPEAFDQARAQIGQQLQRAAFGENPAGDKLFTPERYAKALRDLGTDKLSAFFNPTEIEQLKRLGRIGAYQNATPSAAAVNTSNSGSTVANLLSKGAAAAVDLVPGGSAVRGALTIGKERAQQNGIVNAAMAAEVSPTKAPLSPEDTALLAKLLGVTAGGTALATAPGFRQK